MKKLLTLALIAIMMLGLVACGGEDASQTDSAYVKEKGELVVGITLFKPMNYNENGKLVGFETEFAEAVSEKIGVKAKFQEIDWNSKEMELNSKAIDCIWNGMTITDERKENMSISVPYMKNNQVMVVKADNADKYKDGVKGASVVAEAGSAGEELALANAFFADAEFTAVDSMAKALMDVAAGTSDVAIVDYVTTLGSIGEGTDYEDLVVVAGKNFEPEEQYGIAFRKGSDLTEEVNKAIEELIADGTLMEIAKKYKLEEQLIVK